MLRTPDFNSLLDQVNLACDLCAVGLKSWDLLRTEPDFSDEKRIAESSAVVLSNEVWRDFCASR